MFRNALNSVPGFESIDQQPNGGGLLSRIRLIPTDWVEQLDVSRLQDRQLQPGFLILRDDKLPVDVFFAHDSGSYTEEPADDVHTLSYRQSVSFQIPRDRPELPAWLDQLQDVTFLALIKDRNHYCRLLGTLDQPLRLGGGGFATSGRGGKNGRTFSFQTISQTPSFFVAGIEDTELEPAGTFDSAFFYDVFDV